MLRVITTLEPELEGIIHQVIGCCIVVHKALGPGLLERIYQKAVALELNAAGIPYEREKRFPVIYRGKCLFTHRVDFVVSKLPAIVDKLRSLTRTKVRA